MSYNSSLDRKMTLQTCGGDLWNDGGSPLFTGDASMLQDAPFSSVSCILKRALPHLPPVAEELVGKDDRHHRFSHWNGADADAGVVAAFGRDVGVFTGFGDGLARCED